MFQRICSLAKEIPTLINRCVISGPVLAFAQTIHMTASFLSPIAAGLLTQESVSVVLYFLWIFPDGPLKWQVYNVT